MGPGEVWHAQRGVALLLLAMLLPSVAVRPTAPRDQPTPPGDAAGEPPAVIRLPPTAPTTPSASISVITHGPRDRQRVALTFDADMTRGMLSLLQAGKVRQWYDASILDQLRATHTPATVFLTGLWARTYPDVVRSLAADPRIELANHSYDHAGWQKPCFGLPVVEGNDAKRHEVEDSAAQIEALTHVSPRYFRFPGGCHSDADLRIVVAAREQPVGWDAASGDAFQGDPAVVVRNVLVRVRPGSIIVMHLMGVPNAPASSAALRTIIPELKRRGFEFVLLSELLGSAIPNGTAVRGAGGSMPCHRVWAQELHGCRA